MVVSGACARSELLILGDCELSENKVKAEFHQGLSGVAFTG